MVSSHLWSCNHRVSCWLQPFPPWGRELSLIQERVGGSKPLPSLLSVILERSRI